MQWRVSSGQRCAAVLLCFCALASRAALAGESFAQRTHAGDVHAFQVPAQSFSASLLELARQADCQLVVAADIDVRLGAKALNGRMSVEQALKILLDGLPLRYRISSNRVIVITPAEARTEAVQAEESLPKTSELPPMQVSARRRTESWMDVPMQVSILEGATLYEKGLGNVASSLQLVPSVTTVDTGASFTQVQIRGISSSLGENDNGFYLDDAPFSGVTVPWHPDVRAYDIEKIEVLRGPQGTLFGEGSLGGTVRIFTGAPDLEKVKGNATFSAATTQSGGSSSAQKLMLNAPLVNNVLGVRAVFIKEEVGGWVQSRDGTRNINSQSIEVSRLRARWEPADDWRIDAIALRSKVVAPGGSNLADNHFIAHSVQRTLADWRTLTTNVQHELPVALATYTHSQSDLSYALGKDRLTGDMPASNLSISMVTDELRFASTSSAPIAWVTGYSHKRSGRTDKYTATSGSSTQKQQNSAQALFGELTARSSNGMWAMSLGARHYSEDMEADGENLSGHFLQSNRYSRFSPRLSISHSRSPAENLYASVSTGFRSGQAQSILSITKAEELGMEIPLTLPPDSVVSYEVGFKKDMPAAGWRAQGAVFLSKWKGIPSRVPLDDIINYLISRGRATLQGAEVELVSQATEHLEIALSASYTDSNYRPSAPSSSARNSHLIYNVPKLSSAISFIYQRDIGANKFLASGVAYHHTARKMNLLGQPTRGDSITSASLRIGMTYASRWGTYLTVDNLTNESGSVDAPRDSEQATRLRPRTLGLQLTLDF